MHINVEHLSNHAIVHLRGEFDTYYVKTLQQEIDELTKSGVTRVVLSLRHVKFINSTALGAIIKASKTLAAKHGKLVISRPSPFCREIIEKVGLDRVVPIFDDEEAAGRAVVEGGTAAGSKAPALKVEDEGSVLFSPGDEKRIQHFLSEAARKKGKLLGESIGGKSWSSVGRMASLDERGVHFTWNGGDTGLEPFAMGQLLAIGTELKLKFRLPLFMQGFCEATGTVSEIEERTDGVKVGATFAKIDDKTLEAVRQYAKDLKFLRDELRKATGG
ncbi:MAG: STAS domain-containing protein [Planctomycetes bacterium]|nr:STAS domain-containing protein [Planctomycetota bacterium]